MMDDDQDPWSSPISTEGWLWAILVGLLVESLLYGMHVILFVLCVRVLLRRRRRMQIAMLVAVVIMFVLASADVGISWNIAIRHPEWMYVGDSRPFMKAIYPKFLLHLVNGFVADALLVVRCYVVWGCKKAILWVAGIMLLVGTAFGALGEGTTSAGLKKYIGVYIISVLVMNIALTLATAGRILYIAREVKLIVGRKMVSQYHFAVCILIESGLLYTAATVLVFALSPTKLVLMAAAMTIRVVCIVPILLIVQIALGQATKDVNTTVSMIQAGTKSQIILDTIISTGDYEVEREEVDTHQLPTADEPMTSDNAFPEIEQKRNAVQGH